MTTNQLKYWELQETKKHNRKTEEQADTKMSNDFKLGSLNLAETKRSNIAKETETNRSNLARENENNRSNLANEALKSEQNAIARYNAGVNMIEAQTHQYQAAETARSNRAQESISYANLAELNRSNTAKETAQNFQNYTNRRDQQTREQELSIKQQNADVMEFNAYEQNRANLAREHENYRHDLATETETHRQNVINELNNVANTLVNQQNAYTNLLRSAKFDYKVPTAVGK